jgi:hypothetical protein
MGRRTAAERSDIGLYKPAKVHWGSYYQPPQVVDWLSGEMVMPESEDVQRTSEMLKVYLDHSAQDTHSQLLDLSVQIDHLTEMRDLMTNLTPDHRDRLRKVFEKYKLKPSVTEIALR